MDIATRIQEDLKSAMKQRERIAVSTLRLLSAALKNEAIAKRGELEEADILRVLQREVKRRKEAIESYKAAGSRERVEQETAELAVLQRYLPEQLDLAAIEGVIHSLIQETGATGPQDFGNVMKRAMQQLQGKADGRMVQEAVKRLLQTLAGE